MVMATTELRRGPRIRVTPEQAQQAREAMNAGATMAAAARALGVSRAALGRSLRREHLTTEEVLTEVSAMRAELARLHAFEAKVLSLAAEMSGEKATA